MNTWTTDRAVGFQRLRSPQRVIRLRLLLVHGGVHLTPGPVPVTCPNQNVQFLLKFSFEVVCRLVRNSLDDVRRS